MCQLTIVRQSGRQHPQENIEQDCVACDQIGQQKPSRTLEGQVLDFDRLHVEADGWHGADHLIRAVQLVENGGLASIVQTKN